MFYIILIFSIFLDLLTKNIASQHLDETIEILWNSIFLSYHENTGIAFSIQLPTLLLKILTVILILAIFYYYKEESKKQSSKLLDISFWLILWWAIGNAYERILHEKVIDFIGIQNFAVFNLADSSISLGAFLYCILLYKQHINKS